MVNLVNPRCSDTHRSVVAAARVGNTIIDWFNITGVSSENENIPIYALKANKNIFNKLIVEYSILMFYNVYRPIKTYNALYQSMGSSSVSTRFQTKAMDNPLGVCKGMIYEYDLVTKEVEVLFLVAVKTEYMIKFASATRISELDTSKFTIFVAKKFMTHPDYKRIYSKLNKDIIMPHLERGVDIVMTSNIAEKCFKNSLKIPKFKTLKALRDYLFAFNKEI